MTRQVLLTGVDDGMARKVVAPLRDRGHLVHEAPWDERSVDLVLETGFDAIVVGFPVQGAALGRFLSAVRARQSPCQRSGVVLLARPGSVTQARQFTGHGANRVVATIDAPLRLVRAVNELLAVAPRLKLRIATRIVLKLSDLPLQAFCQTENVSRTGMLVRGFGHYPVGVLLDFELNLPDESDPIRGAAEVSRTTNVAREQVRGFGARFLRFEGSDRSRLEGFLAEQGN